MLLIAIAGYRPAGREQPSLTAKIDRPITSNLVRGIMGSGWGVAVELRDLNPERLSAAFPLLDRVSAPLGDTLGSTVSSRIGRTPSA